MACTARLLKVLGVKQNIKPALNQLTSYFEEKKQILRSVSAWLSAQLVKEERI